jgi:RNA polymerase sigma-70 factor (ECF subfamily)
MIEEEALVESEVRTAFEEHKDTIYRFAWRMTNSSEAAKDITQEVFLTLLRQPNRFDTKRGQMRPFLLGIARNLILKSYRRDKNRWAELDEAQFTTQPLDIVGLEIAELISATVQTLPPLQREVLILAHYEGLTLEEIARAVGVDAGAVKSRLHRARENLRQALAPLKELMGSSQPHGTAK